MTTAYLREVDGLRAVAVLSVLLFHAGVAGFPGGFVGVDVFFTISGFVITRAITPKLADGSFSFADFYIRRVRRLFPAMLFTVAGTLIAARWIMPPDLIQNTAQGAMYAVLSVSNVFFWLASDYFDTSAELKPFLHTWSLSVEEQFYLVWPLLMATCFHGALRQRHRAGIVIVTLSVLSLAAAQWMLSTDMSAAFYLTPFRFFEFGLGGLCALYFDGIQSRLRGWTGEGTFAAGAGLVLVPVFAYSHDTPFPGLMALIPTAGAALVILACRSAVSQGLLGNALSVVIGRASYSIYLVHWPIIVLYGIHKVDGFTLIDQAAIVAASVAIGYAMLLLVETPFRVARESDAEHVPFMFGASIAALVLVALSANTWVTGIRTAQAGVSSALDGMGFKETIETLCPKSEAVSLPGYSCELGTQKTRYDAVVFGDSHTGHLIPGLAEFARENRLWIRIDGSGGTFPGIGVRQYRGPEFQASKERMIAKFYDWLADIPPTTVVLAARWDAYFDASRPPDQADAPLMYLVGAEGDDFTPGDTTRNFKRSLTETVEYLRGLGHAVVLVGQVPPLGQPPHACFAKLGVTNESQDGNACRDFTRKEALARVEGPNAFLASLAVESGVSYIDAVDFFCPKDSGYCRVFDGDDLLYRDGNHLSAVASASVARSRIGPLLLR